MLAFGKPVFGLKHLLLVIGAFIGLGFLYNRFFKPKRSGNLTMKRQTEYAV